MSGHALIPPRRGRHPRHRVQMALAYAAIRQRWQVVVATNRGARGIAGRQGGRGISAARGAGGVAVSAETLATIRSGLYGVVSDPKGTAYKARSHHIEVAARRHRASVRGGRVGKDDPPLPLRTRRPCWFVGYAPGRQAAHRFSPSSSNTEATAVGGSAGGMEIVDNYFEQRAAPRRSVTASSGAPHGHAPGGEILPVSARGIGARPCAASPLPASPAKNDDPLLPPSPAHKEGR